MKTFTIRTSAQLATMVDSIEHTLELIEDDIDEQARDIALTMASDDTSELDAAIKEIAELKKQRAFYQAYLPAIKQVPVGISCYLESNEVKYVIQALEAKLDIEDEMEIDNDAILGLFTVANIENTILRTSRTWGAVDPERLAIELQCQLREMLEGTTATRDLLNQLK